MIMLLSIIFTVWRLIAQARAENEKIKLKFKDGQIIEYDTSTIAVSTCEFISKCSYFNKKTFKEKYSEPQVISMECSSQTFSIIDRLTTKNAIMDWDEIAREFTSDILFELFWVIDYLCYEDYVMKEIHEILFDSIFPRAVLTILRGNEDICLENIDIPRKSIIIKILSSYFIRYGVGMRIENDVVIVCRDIRNEYQKEITNDFNFSKLKILPEAMNTIVDGAVKTDEKKRLIVILWLFDELLEISMLDLSGCIIADEHMEQFDAMVHLEVLNLKDCDMSLNKDYNEIKPVFNVLEDLDISGMKLKKTHSAFLCKITSLKRLSMKKCFIGPEFSFEFIKKQANLEELRIGRNRLSEEQLNIIFGHESIKVLDMEACSIEDMYMFGGKIESLEILKILDGGKMYIKEDEIRITVSKGSDECCLEKWEAYSGRLIFFGNKGVMNLNFKSSDDEVIENSSNVSLDSNSPDKSIEKGLDNIDKSKKVMKVISKRLNVLNGSRIFFEKNKGIVKITLLNTNNILEGLKEAVVYFNVEKEAHMNFLEEAKAIEFLKNVEEFGCRQVYFEDKQLEMVLLHGGLKKLNMRQCGLEPGMIMKIVNNNNLEVFDLSNNNMIGEDEMIHIINECPKLKHLNLSSCKMLVTRDFEEVPILKDLKELRIKENKLNPSFIKYIFRHSGLQRVNLENCGLIENSLEGIEKLKELKELYVGDNFIGKMDFARIFKCNELEVLSMPMSRLFAKEYNKSINIGVNGIKKLTMLKTLDISNNSLSEVSRSGDSLSEVDINEIFQLKNLENLNLNNCGLSPGKLKSIDNLINLKKLNMKKNTMNKEDMDGIADLPKLKELNISKCNIYGDQVFENIRKLNSSLTVLNIQGCFLKKEDIDMLGSLTNLQELQIRKFGHFETIVNSLNKFTSLRVLYWSNIDARKIKNWDIVKSLGTVEILELSDFDGADIAIKNLGELINLKELTLKWERKTGYSLNGSNSLDISVFPKCLRKLIISGDYYYSLDISDESAQDDMRSYENLEVFEVSNLMNISKNVIRKIAGCPKLRELKITTNLYSNWIVKYDLKEIGKVVTLEKLALDGIDLSDKGGIELTGLKHLRQLKLRFCRLNNEYLNDMEKLKSLELLDITQNTFDTSMNEILKLKNLRVLKVYGVRFDYDEKGSFNLVKGFEEVECYRWEIYQNGNHITYKDSSSIDILSEMQREATLSNWKGVGKISIWPIDINSALFIAISSKLVFVKNVMLDICTESTLNYDRLEILKNCLALREINWRNCGLRVCLPLSASTSLVNNKPLLQRIEMTVKNLSSELANALLKARYLHTIDLYAEKYSDGFFETLFKRKLNESNVLVSVKIFFTIPITEKTLSVRDVDAIEKAMAKGIKVNVGWVDI